MQLRGPVEKPRFEKVLLPPPVASWLYWSHRSGRNSAASSPHSDVDLCSVYACGNTLVPASIEYPNMDSTKDNMCYPSLLH
jgi:hypothetical protein